MTTKTQICTACYGNGKKRVPYWGYVECYWCYGTGKIELIDWRKYKNDK